MSVLKMCLYREQEYILYIYIYIDCKSAKSVLQKDVKNITSKHIFARWKVILNNFDFQIEYIKWENNSISDFLMREFLQDSQDYDPPKKKNNLLGPLRNL